MVGPIILAVSAIVLLGGFVLVGWDWTVRSDPDAKRGGPVVAIAIVGLLCGGIGSCAENMKDVAAIKAAQKVKP